MAIYQQHKYVCIVWGFVEVLCFGGTIYGWGSLVFVLKDEGFYSELCGNHTTSSESELVSIEELQLNVSEGEILYVKAGGDRVNSVFPGYIGTESNDSQWAAYKLNYSHMFETDVDKNNTRDQHVPTFATCSEQEERLNLWFSVGVSVMYFACAGIGQMIYHLGIRVTRIVSMCVFTAGGLCIAFASKETPWLICPGLCGIGVSGMVVYGTNLQLCNLIPVASSTIVAIVVGLFDCSTILQEITKVNYQAGIARQYTYLFAVGLHIVLISVSTFFFLPKMYIPKDLDIEMVVEIGEKGAGDVNTSSKLESVEETPPLKVKVEEVSLISCLMSVAYLLHLFWMSSTVLRFISFIGFLNVFLDDLSGGIHSVVSYYLGIFSYITMFAVATALIWGLLYDWQRRKYKDSSSLSAKFRPVLLPMMLCGFLSTVVTVMAFVPNLQVCFATFVVFTFFRSGLFTVAVAFIVEAFPTKYFGVLFGFMQFSAGLSGLIQYGIFAWSEEYAGAKQHVDIFLLILGILTFIHPINLWRKSRHCDTDRTASSTNEKLLNHNKPDAVDT